VSEQDRLTERLMAERRTPLLCLDLDGTVRHGKDELGHFVNGPEDVIVFPEAVEMMRRWKDALAEVDRLRGLLARLEWVGGGPVRSGSCPACGAAQPDHVPDCWLAAELRP
jgi:hypothetical protein